MEEAAGGGTEGGKEATPTPDKPGGGEGEKGEGEGAGKEEVDGETSSEAEEKKRQIRKGSIEPSEMVQLFNPLKTVSITIYTD